MSRFPRKSLLSPANHATVLNYLDAVAIGFLAGCGGKEITPDTLMRLVEQAINPVFKRVMPHYQGAEFLEALPDGQFIFQLRFANSEPAHFSLDPYTATWQGASAPLLRRQA